jgi:hypothetical protein
VGTHLLLGGLDLEQELASVAAGKELVPGVLDVGEAALDDVLGALDLALAEPLRQLLAGGDVLGRKVKDDEALHADALRRHLEQVADALGLLAGRVVARDAAAHDEARAEGGAAQRQLEDLSANVVPVDVDEVGRQLDKVLGKGGRLVVEHLIETEVLLEPVALLVGTSNTDDVGALDLGDLTDDGAGGTSSTRDDNDVAGLYVTNLIQAKLKRLEYVSSWVLPETALKI